MKTKTLREHKIEGDRNINFFKWGVAILRFWGEGSGVSLWEGFEEGDNKCRV